MTDPDDALLSAGGDGPDAADRDRDAGAADRDAAAADRDGAAADRDGAASDRDRGAAIRRDSASDRDRSEGDRSHALRDRLDASHDRVLGAADRDFALFDRSQAEIDREHHDDPPELAEVWRTAAARRDFAASLRDAAGVRRDHHAVERDSMALDRDLHAESRDRAATIRDAGSDARDLRAEERDHAAAARDVAAARRDLDAIERDRAARRRSNESEPASIRLILAEAANDRDVATVDRVESAMDRLEAGEERIRLRTERADTLAVDELTGLLTQGAGLRILRNDMERPVDEPYTVALLEAHQAEEVVGGFAPHLGSTVRELAQAIRAETTGLDLVFRWDGEQILAGFQSTVADEAALRLRGIAARLAQSGLSLHAGLAELSDRNSPEDLIRGAGDTLGPIPVRDDESGGAVGYSDT